MNNNDANNGLNSQVLGGSVNNTTNNPQTGSSVVGETPVQTEVLGGISNTQPVNNTPVGNTVNGSVNGTDNAYHAETLQNNANVQNGNAQVNPTSTVNPSPTPMANPAPAVEPAYTNPQTINPTPNTGMPGFDSSSVIGTTPPVSLEEEKKPQKKKGGNKILFIILIIVVIVAVGGITYYVLNSGILNSNKTTVTINTQLVTMNMGESIPTDVSVYAEVSGTTISNCSVDTSSVDNNVEGTYQYTVTCGETIKTGKIVVIDNTELVLTTQTVYKIVGDTIDVREFVVDADSSVTYTFVSEETVQTYLETADTYTVQITATKGSKTTTESATLIVLSTAIKGYLTCKSSDQVLTEISASVIVREQFALLDDGNYTYSGITQETYEYTFTDQEVYNNYVNEYYANATLAINGVTGTPGFDDSNLIIELTNVLDNAQVLALYGEDNMTNYSSIKNYFEGTLGYKCTYSKVD